MAGERLKFRCYQCSQLLASSPGKAGSIVSCPRCKAELVVPAAESTGPGEPRQGPVGKASGRATSTLTPPKAPVPAYIDEIAAAIPADLADLRPEDLRVEAEFFHSLGARTRSLPNPRTVPGGHAGTGDTVSGARSGPPAAPSPDSPVINMPAAQLQSPEPPGAVPWLAAAGVERKARTRCPPIEIEAPSILPPEQGSIDPPTRSFCPRRSCSPGHCSD